MDLGVHLPLMQFGEERLSLGRLGKAVDAARECGFAAVSANDHFVFQTPWLDGPTALASMIERSGRLTLATTVSLAVLRGPVAAGQGAGRHRHPLRRADSSPPWGLAHRSVTTTPSASPSRSVGSDSTRRSPCCGRCSKESRCRRMPRYYPVPSDLELAPRPRRRGGVPLWVGSWGSTAGLARVARAADGWLASAYNTTPERFSADRAVAGARARGPGQGRERLSERARHDVDLGLEGSSRGRSSARRRPGSAAEPRSRRAARAGLRRPRGALRGAPLSLRARPGASASTCGRWARSSDNSSWSRPRWFR